nr:unnamed protein product [Callosobruchus analis]
MDSYARNALGSIGFVLIYQLEPMNR